jgi:hypothetical protein
VDASLPEAGTGGPDTAADGIFMGIDKAAYVPGKGVRLTVRGLPEEMYGAFISVNGNWYRGIRPKPVYDELNVYAPNSDGLHEIALHDTAGNIIVSLTFITDESLRDPNEGIDGEKGPGDDTVDLPPQIIVTRETMEFAGATWLVLERKDGMALVVSEYVLDNKRYHDTSDYVTWETCSLRAWLNGEYYQSFGAEDRARIALTTVVNKDNPWYYEESAGNPYAPAGGADTQDYIFLLSLEEVVGYFGDSGQLAKRPLEARGIVDIYSASRLARDSDSGYAHSWWLRSPGSSARHAALQHFDGELSVGGQEVNTSSNGVRPAMWVYMG